MNYYYFYYYYSCDGKAEFLEAITPVFSVTWSFRNHQCWKQCYLTMNSYLFYKVADSNRFVQPHSYDFVRFLWGVGLGAELGVVLHMNSYEIATS